MTTLRKKHRTHFTIVPNQVICDIHLSYKARGIWLYLWSLPDTWDISLAGIQAHSQHDGQAAVRSGVAELERAGYLSISRVREHGKFTDTEWVITAEPEEKPSLENPKMEKPSLENPKMEKPSLENQSTLKYLEDPRTKEERNTEEQTPSVSLRETSPPPAAENHKPAKRQRTPSQPTSEESTVLAHLNTVHSRDFRDTSEISKILRTGRSVADCILVIDWCWAVDRLENPEGYERYFNTISPFRPKNFERIFDRAQRWEKKGRPEAHANGNVSEEQQQRAIAFLQGEPYVAR